MDASTVVTLLSEAQRAELAGHLDQACQTLRRAIALAGSSQLGCDARLRLGRLLIHTGLHADEARSVLEEARQIGSEGGAVRLSTKAIHLLALLARQNGRLDEADSLLEASPAPHLNDVPGNELAQWLHYRGLVAASRADLAVAERLCLRAHQFYTEQGCEQGLAEVCTSLGNILLQRGKTRPALAFARQGLAVKERLGNLVGQAISKGTIGRILLMQARYAEARIAFEEDMQLAQRLGDRRGMLLMWNSLGEVALAQRRWDDALASFNEARRQGESPTELLHATMGVVRAGLGAGQFDEAGPALAAIEALPFIPGSVDDRFRHACVAGLRGMLLFRTGDLAKAEPLLIRAGEVFRELNRAMATIPCEYALRDLLHAQGRTAEAVRVMARALEVLAECGSEQGVRDVEDWLRQNDDSALLRLSLSRHVPDHLIDGILGGQLLTLPPRRQEVTVLFTDIRDYTTMTERLEPEEVVEILNEWFVEVTRAIRRHAGVVNQFIGDAIMALFGVPEPREDAAADAVRAALEIREALAAFNLRRQALGLQMLGIGLGIHTGPAVVGFVGSHLRQTYTAVGDVVNTAARLETLTREAGTDIILSEAADAGQQRHGVAETTFLGERLLKGRSQTIRYFAVNGRRHSP